MSAPSHQFDRTGIILYVIKYDECITFYRDILHLDIHFKTDMLTCFQFGSSYLMVEVDDEFSGSATRANDRDRTCLRMNVDNVKASAYQLQQHGIAVDYQEQSWGTVAKFRDPDGNLIAFKDSEKFEQQIQGN